MSNELSTQTTDSRPPQPSYILRGHKAAIHSLAFLRRNSRLLSGDADGYVVLWSLATKRPTAVWHAHDGAILGVDIWDAERLITQGRDGKIRVWRLRVEDEESGGYSTLPPLESNTEHRKQPWLEHSLDVHTVNFCAFAKCHFQSSNNFGSSPEKAELLLAACGSNDSEVEIYHLPSEEKKGLIPAPYAMKDKTGMVMALRMLQSAAKDLCIIVGYENGSIYVFKSEPEVGKWKEVYSNQPHNQPVLSLDISPGVAAFFSSAADAIIAKMPLSFDKDTRTSEKKISTGHAGQQSLQVRSDGKIFATGGWDSRVRVYSVKTMKELAVLKWHREGCYAVAFATVTGSTPGLSGQNPEPATSTQVSKRNIDSSLQTVQEARNIKAQSTHWLAAGSKDGKISLWDIY